MSSHEPDGATMEPTEPVPVDEGSVQPRQPVRSRRPRRPLACAAVLFLVLACMVILTLATMSGMLKSGGIVPGAAGQLLWPNETDACIFAASDKESHRHMYEAMRTKDMAMLGSMTRSGEMLILEEGTGITVQEVDSSINAVRVLIMDGDKEGRSCWVLKDYVNLGSHGKRISSPESKSSTSNVETVPPEDEPESAGSAFRTVRLPHGISLSVPKSWNGIPSDVAEQSQAAAEAVLDLSGIEFNHTGYTELLAITQPLQGHLGMMKLSIHLEKGGYLTQGMQSRSSPTVLAELDETQRAEFAGGFRELGMRLVEWHPVTLQEINGNYYYCSKYELGTSTGEGTSCLEQYQMHDLDRLITFTITYAKDDRLVFMPICRKTLMSLKVRRGF